MRLNWREAKELGDKGEQRFIKEFVEPNGFKIVKWMEQEIKAGGSPRDKKDRQLLDFVIDKGDGKLILVDVKAKTDVDYYGKSKENRHGIDGDCYRAYLSIAEEMNIPAYIAIVERVNKNYTGNIFARKDGIVIDLGDILFISISVSPVNQEYGERKGYEKMVYWSRDQFTRAEDFLKKV
jgi:hypothetical protein